MKKVVKSFVIFFISTHLQSLEKSPRLTVVIVVDQLAYAYFPKFKDYFSGGFKTLLDKGINFTNAYLPHGMPATGTGHAGLGTGTYAKDHGIIANGWYEHDGSYTSCDDDASENARVFSPSGLYDFGKSPKNIMVDGISDAYIVDSPQEKNRVCCSVSLKSRAAICTAGRKGKAIWFDGKSGNFTSSKAYFNELPDWLKKFNDTQTYKDDQTIVWQPFFSDENNKAYSDVNNITYEHTRYEFKLIGKNVSPVLNKTQEKPFDMWSKTPFANKVVFDAAQAALEAYFKGDKTEMLLWVCPSSLDKVGHFYGPDSKEAIDMLYHLDKQIKDFINYVNSLVGAENALFILTADHGIMPFVEVINSRGELEARRISVKNMRGQVNEHIEKKYGLKNILGNFKAPHFYLNHESFDCLKHRQKKRMLEDIKCELQKVPGVKTVWTSRELARACFDPLHIENYFKFQLYPGRSGDIVIQTQPNNMLTSFQAGTSHRNPYEDNTHIPLIFYQEGHLMCKRITQRVWGLQLANTLAEILHIPKPSASTFEVLPGLIEEKKMCEGKGT